MAIGECYEANFFPFQEFFDDQALAGGANEFAVHELPHGRTGFVDRLGYHDPFTRREAIGFQYHWGFVFVERFQCIGFVGCGVKTGGGDVVAREKILGEDLAAFELGGGLYWTEDGAAVLAELIDDAVDEWGFRAHYSQVNAVLGGELEVVAASQAGRRLRDSRIAGGGIYTFHRRALREAPGEGVFAAAGSDHKYVQRNSSSS